jgi:leucyl aminopeptidase (aminopeptidase T)
MVPALRLDYGEVNRRVGLLKRLLDRSDTALLCFEVAPATHELRLDLRHRTAHASGGLLHEPGTAGNLPSGESYIVPYEGEIDDDPSRSEGTLPVEIDGEVVLHRIQANRAVEILTKGPVSLQRATAHRVEPAATNLAELGLGVLSDFGVRPIGEVLLDEKLGLHIAFGRSEHFGGQVGPADFSRPEAVLHQDWVYLPEIQPKVVALTLRLEGPDGGIDLIRDGRWVLDFE